MITEKYTGRPSMEELDMIREFIMYPHLISMVQKSMDDLSYTQITLKNVLMRCQEHVMFAINDDYRKIKGEMRKRGIKVEEKELNDGILYFHFYCRGYDERFGVVREWLRSEIVRKLTSYTNELGKQLKNRP